MIRDPTSLRVRKRLVALADRGAGSNENSPVARLVSEFPAGEVETSECRHCKRSFLTARLAKHEAICQEAKEREEVLF